MVLSQTSRSWAAGLTVSVTGFDKEERREIKDLVEAGGGEYVPYLNRRCTHLIISKDCNAMPSKKLAIALQNHGKWKTFLVSLDWILRSSAAGMCLDEWRFLFNTRSFVEVIQFLISGAHTITLHYVNREKCPQISVPRQSTTRLCL
jgi:twin BRCT domain